LQKKSRIKIGGRGRNKMKLTRNTGMLLLGIWLVVTGLLQMVGAGLFTIHTVLAVLAIAAGIFILAGM
jgi:hypothetical protein